MKILHVVGGLQKASGVTVFVKELSASLAEQGHEVWIVTNLEHAEFFQTADVVHIHGLWTPFLHQAHRVARKLKKPVVWSPHGMLQKWALRNKWPKKILALALYQWWDLRSAQLLHATAESEVADIRRVCLGNRVVVAPLGVRMPPAPLGIEHPVGGKKVLLFVSRVQRKKGLPNLIKAWSLLAASVRKDWTIRIVGPDQDNHTEELRCMARQLHVAEDICFVGPRYDTELSREYAGADLFVLPTHSENFGSVVVESLSHGVPVICTKGAPWQDLVDHQCGWWIDDSCSALLETLKSALTAPVSALEAMGRKGQALVSTKYTWGSVAGRLAEAYAQCCNAEGL